MIKAALIMTVVASTYGVLSSPAFALNPTQLAQNKSTATATVENGASSQTESTSINRGNLKTQQGSNSQVQIPATVTSSSESNMSMPPSASAGETTKSVPPVIDASPAANDKGASEPLNTERSSKESVTERTTVMNNTSDVPQEKNIMYMAIFGILALLIIAVLAIIIVRRRGN
jgi:cobalamin biosynthesis Mg chelatase CobN